LDFMRLKGLMNYHNEIEVERAQVLDSFFKRQLEIILQEENGISIVKASILKGVIRYSAVSSIWLVTLVATLSAGFLYEPSWAWLPSFSVILTSMFACLAAFTYMRYLSAERLLAVMEGRGAEKDGTWDEWEDLGRRYFVYLDGISSKRKIMNRQFTTDNGGAMESAAKELDVSEKTALVSDLTQGADKEDRM